MAFTSAEQAKIREYLGWGARFAQTDSSLQIAMEGLASFPDDETQVRAALTELTNIDTRLAGARDRLQASSVGTIALNPGEIIQLRAEGRRYCQTIANILRVEIRNGGKFGSNGGGWMVFG